MKVYPTKSASLSLIHPTHGPMLAEGTFWPDDAFTFRRIQDGSISVEPVVDVAEEHVEHDAVAEPVVEAHIEEMPFNTLTASSSDDLE